MKGSMSHVTGSPLVARSRAVVRKRRVHFGRKQGSFGGGVLLTACAALTNNFLFCQSKRQSALIQQAPGISCITGMYHSIANSSR